MTFMLLDLEYQKLSYELAKPRGSIMKFIVSKIGWFGAQIVAGAVCSYAILLLGSLTAAMLLPILMLGTFFSTVVLILGICGYYILRICKVILSRCQEK